LDPANREVRTQLAKAKQKLQESREVEKRRMSAAMSGGLYQEHHAKAGKLQAAYDAEVARRKEAVEDDISFEDFVKKEKDKEEEKKRKEKEEREQQQKDEKERQQREAYEKEMARRKEAGEDELTFEEWELELQRIEGEVRRSRIGGVMQTDTEGLDADEKKMLEETKSKGYYHGRLGTVLSDEAPKPVQVDADSIASPGENKVGSEWNDAGTWEERDQTAWVKERLTAVLAEARVSSEVPLPDGKAAKVTAKVTKVKSLTGDASMVSVRKKLKHGYLFEAELSFSLKIEVAEDSSAGGSFSGALHLPELVDSVSPADLRIDIRWKGTPPSGGQEVIAAEFLDMLRKNVRAKVVVFRNEYQERR